jgi:ABC-type transporter Mla maintaining outer membrane lipid asymmetry ATPase subunit MlaF
VTPPVLEFAGISKDYHGLRPLRIEQLTVGAAEQVALLGFDQVSAEVFINLATGATLPDTGEVLAFGRSTAAIADSADWLATVDRFGIVSERAVLLDQLTPVQNLAMPFTLAVEPPSDDVRLQAEALASEVGLAADSWTRAVAELGPSGRMRVRLGRALALDPSVLLLEHASAGLDRSDATGFAAQIRAIARRRRLAVVVVTADEAFASAAAGQVLRLEPATGRLRRGRGSRWF